LDADDNRRPDPLSVRVTPNGHLAVLNAHEVMSGQNVDAPARTMNGTMPGQWGPGMGYPGMGYPGMGYPGTYGGGYPGYGGYGSFRGGAPWMMG